MTTDRRRAFIINFTYFLILIGAGYLLLKHALPVLMPFVLGFCFAYLLRKPIRYLTRQLKLKRKLCAIAVVVVFYAAIGCLISLLSVKAASGVQSFIDMVPGLYESRMRPLLDLLLAQAEQLALRLDPEVVELVDEWGNRILQSLGQLAYSLSMWAMSAASGFAASLPGLFIKLLVTVISTFFIAIDYDKLTGFCMCQLKGEGRALFLQIKEYLIGTLFVCLRSYALIMSITFMELAIGLTLMGFDHAVLIAAFIAVFDILPVLGTGGIMIPWAAAAAITGRYSTALGLFAIYLFVTVVRNIIEPKIVGGQLGLHPVVTLASMFLGAQALGVVGVFGFPIGLSLLIYLNDKGAIRLFRRPGQDGA